MINQESFIEELLGAAPIFKPAFAEHLNDNKKLLPHVFMGEVTRLVIAEAATTKESRTLAPLIDVVEEALTIGSQDVKDLIRVSFVENLIGEPAAVRTIRKLMGPTLKREVEAMSKR
jgi:hypothetical protein